MQVNVDGFVQELPDATPLVVPLDTTFPYPARGMEELLNAGCPPGYFAENRPDGSVVCRLHTLNLQTDPSILATEVGAIFDTSAWPVWLMPTLITAGFLTMGMLTKPRPVARQYRKAPTRRR